MGTIWQGSFKVDPPSNNSTFRTTLVWMSGFFLARNLLDDFDEILCSMQKTENVFR
jgi:hypothetical protein